MILPSFDSLLLLYYFVIQNACDFSLYIDFDADSGKYYGHGH